MTVQFRAIALAVLCSFALANSAQAQKADYPAKPVKIVLGYAAGGFTDVMSRLLAQRLSVTLGQPVVVENRPSAGAVVATDMVAKAPPDGYLLLVADTGSLAVTPALIDNLPYDIVKDLAPITYTGEIPLFLVTNSSVPASTFAELIALIKAKPGQLNFAAPGTGSIHHLNVEALKSAFGLNVLVVQYKGASPSVQALLGGEVAMTFSAYPALLAHLNSGRIRVLAVNTPKRANLSPNTPTIAEMGVPDFNYPAGVGVLAPAGTPAPIIARLAKEVIAAMHYGDNPKRLTELGFETAGTTPEGFAARIKSDLAKYARIVKASGAKAN